MRCVFGCLRVCVFSSLSAWSYISYTLYNVWGVLFVYVQLCKGCNCVCLSAEFETPDRLSIYARLCVCAVYVHQFPM